ncbi:MAG: Sec-independent protein translocase protein TatB [Pseudomonadales bacterium]|jgi:sec-independent protein translocase protein TatB|nr:Sec-independent protein translocase protein TatB [Pseudomonadales bacterium]MDP6471783.1 Sec-independent protein translocase protein TatB [Pseudomonadales bacterium]MDP6828803.1 Sec-independent protein translocase protein TatB [Pseudomonadales bacterium]|tara:strand:- start:1007 stop:1441 length:435 start_codon:yes stop_codon:yes gene_type:complete
MFDIGFPELMLVAVVGLLVIGPDRLPEALRTLGLWFGRMRRSFNSVKTEIEKEIGMDEVRHQLHNEAVMDEMKRIEKEVKRSVNEPISATTAAARDVDPGTAGVSSRETGPGSGAAGDEAGASSEALANDPTEKPVEEKQANDG